MGQVYTITQRRSVFVYVEGNGLPSEQRKMVERFSLTDACEDKMDERSFGEWEVDEAHPVFDFYDCDFVLHEDGTHEEVDYENCSDFLDDEEKMRDFLYMGKEQFLAAYSYLTDTDYEMTRCVLVRRFAD